jgi:hypothetical protein
MHHFLEASDATTGGQLLQQQQHQQHCLLFSAWFLLFLFCRFIMKSLFSSPNTVVDKKKKNDDDDDDASKKKKNNVKRQRQKHTLPLSMQLMKPFAGLVMASSSSSSSSSSRCPDCEKTSHWPPRHFKEEIHNEQDEDGDGDSTTTSLFQKKYDSLFCQAATSTTAAAAAAAAGDRIRLSISPMVVAPMMHSITSNNNSNNNSNHQHVVEIILHDYQVACTFYKCPLNPGVLATFRYALPSLRVSGSSFHDVDMLALVEVLLKYCNNHLSFIRRLDFSNAAKEPKRSDTKYRGFRSHGALALAKLLQQSQHVSEVWLQRNRIGPYGASAIFLAACENKSLHHINMRRCRIMERGGLAFSEIIAPNDSSSSGGSNSTADECGLNNVNLSANFIGFRASMAIEEALTKRDKEGMNLLLVDLEGNLVFQEVRRVKEDGVLLWYVRCIVSFLHPLFFNRS